MNVCCFKDNMVMMMILCVCFFVVVFFSSIAKTSLFKYVQKSPKTENLQIKNSDIFHISAQNIDCVSARRF